MDIGISTASFYTRYVTEDALNIISKLGFKKCETFLESPSEYTEQFGQLLKERMIDGRLKIYSVHSLCSQFEPQLFSMLERQRNDALKILKSVFNIAKTVGAEAYVFHGPANLKKLPIVYDFKRLGYIASMIADTAAEYGVKFTWENVHWCYYNTPEFGEKLRKECSSDNLYYTLDIKQAMLAGIDPFDFVKQMGSRIANVHVCDFDSDKKLMLPGRGIFDFKKLGNMLKQFDYKGPIMIEVYKNNYSDFSELAECRDFLYDQFN